MQAALGARHSRGYQWSASWPPGWQVSHRYRMMEELSGRQKSPSCSSAGGSSKGIWRLQGRRQGYWQCASSDCLHLGFVCIHPPAHPQAFHTPPTCMAGSLPRGLTARNSGLRCSPLPMLTVTCTHQTAPAAALMSARCRQAGPGLNSCAALCCAGRAWRRHACTLKSCSCNSPPGRECQRPCERACAGGSTRASEAENEGEGGAAVAVTLCRPAATAGGKTPLPGICPASACCNLTYRRRARSWRAATSCRQRA
jgi:hypothetical protein